MSILSKLACGLLASALLSDGAVAQSALAPKTISPATESPSDHPESPSAGFQSVLSRYRLYRTIGPASWRDLNVRVAEIGGWKTYARQANAPDEPLEGAADPGNPVGETPPPSTTAEHAGHEDPPK